MLVRVYAMLGLCHRPAVALVCRGWYAGTVHEAAWEAAVRQEFGLPEKPGDLTWGQCFAAQAREATQALGTKLPWGPHRIVRPRQVPPGDFDPISGHLGGVLFAGDSYRAAAWYEPDPVASRLSPPVADLVHPTWRETHPGGLSDGDVVWVTDITVHAAEGHRCQFSPVQDLQGLPPPTARAPASASVEAPARAFAFYYTAGDRRSFLYARAAIAQLQRQRARDRVWVVHEASRGAAAHCYRRSVRHVLPGFARTPVVLVEIHRLGAPAGPEGAAERQWVHRSARRLASDLQCPLVEVTEAGPCLRGRSASPGCLFGPAMEALAVECARFAALYPALPVVSREPATDVSRGPWTTEEADPSDPSKRVVVQHLVREADGGATDLDPRGFVRAGFQVRRRSDRLAVRRP